MIYAPEDSYQVILEVADNYKRDEADLLRVEVRSATGKAVPLSAFATVTRGPGVIAINHQSQLPAVTLSFDLVPGKSLSDAATAIDAAMSSLKMPETIFGAFSGQAALYQQSQTSQLWLILITVAVIYVILGMLYERWIHPLTILLGIPSAAVGALLALRICGMEVSFIAMIGVLLLIGIVKKNAIMMIDFALVARRDEGLSALDAIRKACLLCFRPIMMTTLRALMGALPIALRPVQAPSCGGRWAWRSSAACWSRRRSRCSSRRCFTSGSTGSAARASARTLCPPPPELAPFAGQGQQQDAAGDHRQAAPVPQAGSFAEEPD